VPTDGPLPNAFTRKGSPLNAALTELHCNFCHSFLAASPWSNLLTLVERVHRCRIAAGAVATAKHCVTSHVTDNATALHASSLLP
jgi:hypothetical protein